MIFHDTPIVGARLIELKRIEDHRGFFARAWCQNELRQQRLKSEVAQANVAFSLKRGTLRGLHFQTAPQTEVKVVRCTRGSLFDVIVDLRPDFPSYKRWFGVELSMDNHKMLYVPEGCAQGYITLEDNTEMQYCSSEFYHPDTASGVRFDDPEFRIAWPMAPVVISDQDRTWPDYAGRSAQLKF